MAAIILTAAAAVAISLLFNRKIYETLPVALMAVTLGVYVCALVMPLTAAVYICAGATALALTVSIFLAKKKSPGQILSIKPSIQLFVLVGVCAVFCLLLANHRVIFYDDLSYWGLYTKNIFSIGRLPYLYENCSVDYKDYTPIMQILQYLAMFGRKSFSEPVLFQANICFIYVMLLPLLSGADDKERPLLYRTAAIVMYVIFPHILSSQFYYRLGVDLFLALVFGYALYYIFLEDGRDIFRIFCMVLSLAFLALIKTTGIVLCIFALIMFFVREITIATERKNRINVLIQSAVLAVFAFGSYLSWQMFLRHSGNNGYLSNRVKDSVFGGGLTLPEYAGDVITDYIWHFFTYPLTRNAFGISAFLIVVFITLIFRVKRDKTMYILSVTGLALFCIAHVCMYLFIFDDWEAKSLLEYDRYITQYIGGIFMLYSCVMLGLLGPVDENDKERYTNVVNLALISIMTFIVLLPYRDIHDHLLPSGYKDFYNKKYAQMTKNVEVEWRMSGIPDRDLPHDGSARLTVIANVWDDYAQFLEYTAVPQPIDRFINVPGIDPEGYDICSFVEDTAGEYVYVTRNAPASYKGDWTVTSKLTADSAPLEPGTLYSVTKDDEGTHLQKL